MKTCLAFLTALFLLQTSAFGRTISRVEVGNAPDFVAVNPVTNLIYVANSQDGTVSVVDGVTNTVAATITVGGQPQGIAVNPVTNTIYVAIFAGLDSTVKVIDGKSNLVSQTVDVPGATFLAVNPATNMIYSSDSDNTVRVINGRTNKVVGLVPYANVVEGLAVDVGRNTIYVAVVSSPPSISAIDGSDLQVIHTFSLPQAQFIPGVAADSYTDQIYATDSLKGTVFVIDGSSGAVSATISLPGAVNPKYVALGAMRQILVADPGANEVFIINGNTQSLVASQFIEWGPWGLAVNTTTRSIYVPSSLQKLLTVISF